ncbi:type I toxin-antitoxin system Fst family toxin [Staphylococcus caprae]|uniref:type I toxin-antitoxin system Fst family toxin n=1 Tax=Staphylococcus caprae TaxID=29380 RepID=UPI003B00B137
MKNWAIGCIVTMFKFWLDNRNKKQATCYSPPLNNPSLDAIVRGLVLLMELIYKCIITPCVTYCNVK